MIRVAVLTVLLSTVMLATGCMSFSDRSFQPVTRDIRAQVPGLEMRREFALSVGAMMMNTVDLLVLDNSFDFSAVDKVQIAVYEVAYSVALSNLDVEKSLQARNPGLTWETVVRVREERENTWVLVGIDESRGSIESVSIMVMERNELVLIHVDGDLTEMIELAFDPVRGKPGAFHFS